MARIVIDPDDKYSLLVAQRDALVAVLIAVTPSHRAPGCWCGYGQDIKGFGHDTGCERARAALKAAQKEK